MGDEAEQQADEVEVLISIYEGDDNFKQVDSKTYQYKVTHIYFCPYYYVPGLRYLKMSYV